MHLPAFIDFANVFIRYRSKQSISELSLIATEVVSTTDFFLERNYSYGTKTSINFVDVRSKPRICKLFEFYTIFFSCCTLNSLDSIICRCAWMFHNFYLSVLSYLLDNENTRGTSMFVNVPSQWGLSSGYKYFWICFNIYLSIIYFIWYTARYTNTRWTRVPPNATRSTKLWGA